MKKLTVKLLALLCLCAVFLSFPLAVSADDGINNSIKGSNSGGSALIGQGDKSGSELILSTEDAKKITMPNPKSYFDVPQVLYIDSEGGNSVYAYRLPKVDKKQSSDTPYHGSRVFAVAEQDGFHCVVYYDQNNKLRAGWVASKHMSAGYTGSTQTVGRPCVEYAYDLGDIPVSWSKEYFVGTKRKYTLLSETAPECVQFVLDYHVIARNGAKTSEVLGPRTVYVNDGSGWTEVGSFRYDEIEALHVIVNLPEPMDVKAVATVASCKEPDKFLIRQCVLDVMALN